MALIRGMMMARMATRVNQSDGEMPNCYSPWCSPDRLDLPGHTYLMK